MGNATWALEECGYKGNLYSTSNHVIGELKTRLAQSYNSPFTAFYDKPNDDGTF